MIDDVSLGVSRGDPIGGQTFVERQVRERSVFR